MITNARSRKRIARHIDNLNSPDHDARCRAERYLLRFYVLRAADQLLEVVDHTNPYVRLYAAWVLAHTHDPRAFEPILRLCDDPDERVRYDATVALGILDDPRAIEPLKAILIKYDETRPAGDAFYRIGPKTVPALVDVLREGSTEARWCAVQVMGNFAQEYGDQRCIEMLREAMSDSDITVRENADYWLDEIRVANP